MPAGSGTTCWASTEGRRGEARVEAVGEHGGRAAQRLLRGLADHEEGAVPVRPLGGRASRGAGPARPGGASWPQACITGTGAPSGPSSAVAVLAYGRPVASRTGSASSSARASTAGPGPLRQHADHAVAADAGGDVEARVPQGGGEPGGGALLGPGQLGLGCRPRTARRRGPARRGGGARRGAPARGGAGDMVGLPRGVARLTAGDSVGGRAKGIVSGEVGLTQIGGTGRPEAGVIMANQGHDARRPGPGDPGAGVGDLRDHRLLGRQRGHAGLLHQLSSTSTCSSTTSTTSCTA